MEDTPSARTRRRALAAGAAALAGGLAGCSSLRHALGGRGGPDTEQDRPRYQRLGDATVHVAEGADLSVPTNVETVGTPDEADVVVLPGDTAVDAERAAGWLTDGRALALLGEAAQPTWTDWARSDAFDDAFTNGGYAEADPEPGLLVAGTVGDLVRTYRYSWGGGADDRDVLGAIDDALVDLAAETPR